MANEVGFHGSDDFVQEEVSKYKSPSEYADQGDTRVVRYLMFTYLVETKDAAGNVVLQPRDVTRGTVLRKDQIGMNALKKGEEEHAFYTSDELDSLERSGNEAPPPGAESNINELGEQELAEWLKTGKDGGAYTVDEVLDAVGQDKDLAHRMLSAENTATNGDPRKGLAVGLTHIIEG
jgi:hypothetical protein